jgi:hypothetical protein
MNKKFVTGPGAGHPNVLRHFFLRPSDKNQVRDLQSEQFLTSALYPNAPYIRSASGLAPSVCRPTARPLKHMVCLDWLGELS